MSIGLTAITLNILERVQTVGGDQLPILLYNGSSFAVNFFLVDPSTHLPVDLTSITEIAVSVMSNAPPVCVTKLKSTAGVVIVGSATLGQFQAKFSSADVATFALTSVDSSGAVTDSTTLQAITVKLTNASDPNLNPLVLVVPQALNVQVAPC